MRNTLRFIVQGYEDLGPLIPPSMQNKLSEGPSSSSSLPPLSSFSSLWTSLTTPLSLPPSLPLRRAGWRTRTPRTSLRAAST